MDLVSSTMTLAAARVMEDTKSVGLRVSLNSRSDYVFTFRLHLAETMKICMNRDIGSQIWDEKDMMG